MTTIILTYIIFFSYMILVVVMGELLQRLLKMDPDIVRKIEHILTAPCWLIMYFLCWPYNPLHTIIISGIGTALLGFITFSPFFKSVQRGDAKMSYGVFYFGLICFIVTLFQFFYNQSIEYYALIGICYFTLSLADGLAPLVARLFKNHNIKLREGKSLAGSLTVFIVTFLVILTFNLIFNFQFSWLYMFSFAALIFICEFYGYKGLDNIFIVLFGFIYLMLEKEGLNNIGMPVSFLLGTGLILVNCKIKAVTEGGIVAAVICGTLCAFFGGVVVTILIVTTFSINVIASKIAKKVNHIETKSKPRKLSQILCNISVTTILCILAYFLSDPRFIIAACGVVIEEFADSMASDVGRYCKNRPLDILRFKTIDPGVSGGVSWLGTLVCLISIFAVTPLLFINDIITPLQYPFVALLAFLGVFIDSILGSLIQARYKCEVCGVLTDHKEHCDKPTTQVSGIKFVTNSMVNVLAGTLTAGVFLIFLLTNII